MIAYNLVDVLNIILDVIALVCIFAFSLWLGIVVWYDQRDK